MPSETEKSKIDTVNERVAEKIQAGAALAVYCLLLFPVIAVILGGSLRIFLWAAGIR